MERLRDKLTGGLGLAADVASLVSVVWPFLVGAVGAGLLVLYALPQVTLSILAACLGTAVLVVLATIAIQRIVYLKRIGGQDLNPDWRFVKSRRTCIVHSRERMEVEYELDVIPRKEMASVLRFSTNWTGTGEFRVVSETQGVTATLDDASHGMSELFHLTFSQPPRRGKVVTVKYRIFAEGTKEPQKPFFSLAVAHMNHPRNDNVLEVVFRDTVDVERVWSEHYVIPGPPWPKSETAQQLGVDRAIRLPFKGRVGHRWSLCWSYRGD